MEAILKFNLDDETERRNHRMHLRLAQRLAQDHSVCEDCGEIHESNDNDDQPPTIERLRDVGGMHFDFNQSRIDLN